MLLGCVLGVVLMFALVPGCPSAAPPGGDGGPAPGEIGGRCLSDGSCTEGFCFALDNTCVRCFEEGVACTNSEQCCEDLVCTDGVCAEPAACTTNDDCPEGQICQDGVCVEAPTCATDDDCPDGQICQDGVCVAGPVELRFPYRTTAFDHAPHMTDFGLACTDCHHTEPANAAGQACSACHADEWIAGVPKLKEAMHTTTGEETGNSGCRSCHAQTTEDGSWQCSFCHTELNDL